MTTVGDMLYQMGGVPVSGVFTTGDVFFVSSVTGSTSNDGKTPDTALATLDGATNKCRANTHNVVYIMPNHAETIAASTTWVPDVDGVEYIGVGIGSDAPELTFSATGSTITVTGANNTFKNIRFVAGISAVTTGVTVNAHHVTFENCVWDFSTTAYDFVTHLRIDGYDYTKVENCQFIAENATAGSAAAISLDDAHNVRIRNNIITGDFSTAAISQVSSDAACKSIIVADNEIYNDDTASVTGGIYFAGAGSSNGVTGMISRNMVAHFGKDSDSAKIITAATATPFNNYISKEAGKYGVEALQGTASTA